MSTFRNVTAPVPTKTGVVDIDRFTREISEKITQLNAAINAVGSNNSGGSLTILDEGSLVAATATLINFTGAGVTATAVGPLVTVNIPSPSIPTPTITTQDEGVTLSTSVTTLNFVGGGVTASGAGATTTVTVPTPTITTQYEGSTLSTSATTLNFTGFGIRASGGATTTVTVNGAIIVRVVITTNVASLSGIPASTVSDGYTLVAGDRVLLTGQTTGSQNGIYAVAAGAWSRVELTVNNNASGCRVYALSGIYNYESYWWCKNVPGSDVVGTNSLTWEVESHLRKDLGFDSSDIFAVIYGTDPNSAISTLSSQITPDTWTAHYLNTPTPLTADYGVIRGPFGERALKINILEGLVGPASTYPMPANYTLTFWVFFEYIPDNTVFTSTQLLNVGRTNTNTPTGGGWNSEYIFAQSTPANTAALSGTGPWRGMNILSRDSGGVATTFQPAASGINGGIIIANTWNHVAITRDVDNVTYLRLNGRYAGAVTTTNPPNNTSVGRWIIGRPPIASAAGIINGNYMAISRVRLSGVRSPSYIKEQSSRGLAWVA